MWVDSIASCVYKTRHMTLQSRKSRMGGKTPKKVKEFLRKAGEVFYQTKKLFLSVKKDLKPMQKTERKT